MYISHGRNIFERIAQVTNPYDERYRNPDYWGDEPSAIARRLLEFVPALKETFPGQRLHVLDVGCGDGRDALYYAHHEIEVTGIDSSSTGLARLREKAGQADLQESVHTLLGDLATYQPEFQYHAVVSSGAFHYVPSRDRCEVFECYKAAVPRGGLFALTVIVHKPFIPPAPDAEKDSTLFRSGEVATYFWDWEILWFIEEIKECRSSGVPHEHAFNRIIARKT